MCKTPKSPWQVPDNSHKMGGTPLHLVRTIVAQQYRNAGRQEGQKEEQNAIVSGWIGWIHSPENGKDTEEGKERARARWEGPAVTFHVQCLTLPPGDILHLSKRVLITHVTREGRGRGFKNIILGMLSWRFSLMSQFDRMEKGNVFPDPK